MRRTPETKGQSRDTATLERRAFAMRSFKAVDSDDGDVGRFEGYVACFDNLDGNGDIIDKGAFKKTLAEHYETKSRNHSPYLCPILWQHDEHDPIGGFTDASEDNHGLYVKGELDLNAPNGRRAYSAMKKGYIRGLSIGYDALKTVWDTHRSRHLTEVRWWEGSPVTFPANTDALITNVKSAGGKTDWPLASYGTAWDSGEAHNAIIKKATKADGSLDSDLMKSVHFWYDPDKADQAGGYKLLFCDVIGGDIQAVPKAIQACTGAHGIQSMKSLSSPDEAAIKAKIKTYYGKIADDQKDPSLAQVPWEDPNGNSSSGGGKTVDIRRQIKQMGGLQALTTCAVELDNIADAAGGMVELLGGTCGMAVSDPDNAQQPDPPVAALLSAVEGLPDAIKAVLSAWQDFSQQTDALLSVLGIPDVDMIYETAAPYLAALRSAFDVKAGRQLSQANRDKLETIANGVQTHADQLQQHASDLKSMLHDADRGVVDENSQDNNIDQAIAAGRRPSADYHGDASSGNGGKSRLFSIDYEGAGQKPDNQSTSSPAHPEPGSATLDEFDALLLSQGLDVMSLDRPSNVTE